MNQKSDNSIDKIDQKSPTATSNASAISRREFARRAAIASAVASIAPGSALAGTSPVATATPQSAAAQQPQDLPKLSPESQIEVDARYQATLNQYGTRFSDKQKSDLRRLCIMAQPPLDRLRAYAVENGDGPALYLKPLMEREKKPALKPAAKSGAATQPAAPQKP
jgi:hypothetical protein